MSCSRCKNACQKVEWGHALLSSPQPLALAEAAAALRGEGWQLEQTPMGLQLEGRREGNCDGDGHDAALARALRWLDGHLPEPCRRDLRVAMIPADADAAVTFAAIFNASPLGETVRRLDSGWLTDLLREGRLQVHFHALVAAEERAAEGGLFGYECLIRGRGTDGALISPGRLFDAARTLDLLFLLDQKARVASVDAASRLQADLCRTEAGARPWFFINFLPTAIYNPEHCLKTTLAAIERGGLRPEQICFEVVETEDVADRSHLREILRFYRERGFKVALDDVGAGYSSLMALSDLGPDFIEIDGELVRRAEAGGMERRLVGDLISTAHEADIRVVTEGIETADQLAMAIDLGADILQGYVFGRPAAEGLDAAQQTAAAALARTCRRREAA